MREDDPHFRKRRLRIYTKDEYGQPEVFIISLPIFFPNRPFARIAKVELYDENEDCVIQTIEETELRQKCNDFTQHIDTIHNLTRDKND